ncbi:MAG: hypothetical protein COA71_14470 [SAR86 cluster bacterium]|uniref:Uncharacterized protein n=1 Tax=SAR86 cluster bacterium TaxID=2030880 RepID=A0A2A5C5P7_9GAMM|nr:MAG: hypothetical protein COA71_14470 [SAR86 cluster bacterium]
MKNNLSCKETEFEINFCCNTLCDKYKVKTQFMHLIRRIEYLEKELALLKTENEALKSERK